MNYRFTHQLTEEEQKEWEFFFNSLALATIEQFPSWTAIQQENGRSCFFLARAEGELVCCAIVAERKSGFIRYASIQFGPLFKHPDELIAALKEIARHYRDLNYVYLAVQLALPTGTDSDYVEYAINKDFKTRTYYDRDNWSSLIVSLEKDEEELIRDFSKGHKSDIKKAVKNNIRVVEGQKEDLGEFADIFVKMNKERGLKHNEEDTRKFLQKVFEFICNYKKGMFLVVKNEEEMLIGGIFIIFQGNTARYFKGTSDSAFRHLPVLHLAIWEAMKKSRNLGYKYFDLWGYNHFVSEDDQVFFINRFKKGFGGSYLFYPKKMFIIYRPWSHRIYTMTRQLYNRFLKRN